MKKKKKWTKPRIEIVKIPLKEVIFTGCVKLSRHVPGGWELCGADLSEDRS